MAFYRKIVINNVIYKYKIGKSFFKIKSKNKCVCLNIDNFLGCGDMCKYTPPLTPSLIKNFIIENKFI